MTSRRRFFLLLLLLLFGALAIVVGVVGYLALQDDGLNDVGVSDGLCQPCLLDGSLDSSGTNAGLTRDCGSGFTCVRPSGQVGFDVEIGYCAPVDNPTICETQCSAGQALSRTGECRPLAQECGACDISQNTAVCGIGFRCQAIQPPPGLSGIGQSGVCVRADGTSTCGVETPAQLCDGSSTRGLITFEEFSSSADQTISNQYESLYNLSFRNGDRIDFLTGVNQGACSAPFPKIALYGAPREAFLGPSEPTDTIVTNENPNAERSDRLLPQYRDITGQAFLVSGGGYDANGTLPCSLIIDFSRPTREFSFDILDVEPTGEQWRVQALNQSGGLVYETIVTNDGTYTVGDGTVSSVVVPQQNEDIYQIQLVAKDKDNSGFGLAFDNFSPICAQSTCGNGVCDAGETPETCPNDCNVDPVCGDGEVDAGEQCDSGSQNGVDGICTAQCRVDITVEKEGTVTQQDSASATVSYTLQVTNPYTEALTGVTITDTIPNGTTINIASLAASGGTYSEATRTITWTNQTIPAQGSISFTYTITVPSSLFGTTIQNTVSLPDYPDEDIIEDTDIPPFTPNDPTLAKTGSVIAQTATNATISYQVTVSNPNAQPLTGITIIDTLPTGVSVPTESMNPVGTFTASTGEIRWDGISVPANGTRVISYQVIVPASFFGTTIINNVDIPSVDGEEVDTPVTIPEAVSIEKTSAIASVSAEQGTLSYTVTVTNPASVAQVADVTDLLPAGLDSVLGISDGGILNAANTQITWTGVSVPANGVYDLTYTAVVPSGRFGLPLQNTADVLIGGNLLDRFVLQSEIDYVPLSSTKSAEILDVSSSSATIAYAIRVVNTNPNAIDATITDTLPSGVSSVLSVSPDATSQSNSTIVWEDVSIPAEDSVLFTYEITVPSSAFGTLTNTAITEVDDEEEDSVTEEVTVDPSLSVAVSKDSEQIQGATQTAVDYTLVVRNLSNVVIEDYEVIDTLDAKVQPAWISSGSITNSGSVDGRVITWSNLDIQPDSAVTLRYTVIYPEDAPGDYRNMVSVEDPSDTEVATDSHTVTIAERPAEPIVIVQPISNPTAPTPDVPVQNPQPLPDTSFETVLPLIYVVFGLLFVAIGLYVYKQHLFAGTVDKVFVSRATDWFVHLFLPYDKQVEYRADKRNRRDKSERDK